MFLQVLAFCVLQAFCADSTTPDSTTDDSGSEGARGYSANVVVPVMTTQAAPLQWSQYTSGVYRNRNIRVPIPNNRFVELTSEKAVKEKISICSPATNNEYFMCCEIPHLEIWEPGDIFRISVVSNAQQRVVYGSVGYQQEDSAAGALIVKPPREAPRAVWLSSVGIQPDTFYDFDVREDSLCITRFLVQYYGARQSSFFVRVNIPYADEPPYVEAGRIAVTWGEHITCGGGNMDDSIWEEPVLFDFLQSRGFVLRVDR